MSEIHCYYCGMTRGNCEKVWTGNHEFSPKIQDLIDTKDLNSYDTALPQDWVDDFRAKTGVYPYPGYFVWSYDVAKTFGAPEPLTEEAENLLAVYNG